MDRDEPIGGDEGGEPPCFMERVCMRCGAYTATLRCPVCGHEAGDEVPGPGAAPAG
ncbi:MAG: hypothetical protein IT200_07020 [Thermoleophilia bacterium]|nr:hypothetical protein [Thermoleophilia bacterium]